MPRMVKIEANPDFKADDAGEKEAFAKIKKARPIEVDYVTAMENVSQSGGMYRIQPETTQTEVVVRNLEDMTTEELKIQMLAVGVTPQKQMKRAEVISAIRIKLSEIEIADE
ncbi:MAG: hypothetical protein DI533_00415 [Cereibacter sphaeroides]|uniref:Uncharacterized protein n=1 Tax=Cereibacter sphaeroides TaxID=1063 RepID=A0A2W5SBH4_CERSP|nr:MAG: hypothetical protein DI533_00415 [Cereibacter sphaeroides]